MYYVWKTVMLKGDFTYEFALFPFEGKWDKAGLHQKALEYNFPCVSVLSDKGTGNSGHCGWIFQGSKKHIFHPYCLFHMYCCKQGIWYIKE
jgi:hypothetical protein